MIVIYCCAINIPEQLKCLSIMIKINGYIYIMDYPLGNKREQTTDTSSNMYKSHTKKMMMSNSQAQKYTYCMTLLI